MIDATRLNNLAWKLTDLVRCFPRPKSKCHLEGSDSDMRPRGHTWELHDHTANVLFVTNMWPDAQRPVYGIFVQRQIESLRKEGIRCDILYLRGYLGFHVYPLAAVWLLMNNRVFRRKYSLIHAHAGETALAVSPLLGIPKIASYCGDDILGKANSDGTFSFFAPNCAAGLSSRARGSACELSRSPKRWQTHCRHLCACTIP